MTDYAKYKNLYSKKETRVTVKTIILTAVAVALLPVTGFVICLALYLFTYRKKEPIKAHSMLIGIFIGSGVLVIILTIIIAIIANMPM